MKDESPALSWNNMIRMHDHAEVLSEIDAQTSHTSDRTTTIRARNLGNDDVPLIRRVTIIMN